MNILVLNDGSSSLKFLLVRMPDSPQAGGGEKVLASGAIERLATPDGRLKILRAGDQTPSYTPIRSGSIEHAVAEIVRMLKTPAVGGSPVSIDAVGHRIVHGGPELTEPTYVDEGVLHHIQDETLLAPAHNAAGIACIRAALAALPCTPNVAVFDTSFHHNMPEVASRYAIPTTLFGGRTLRRYGFHGSSYRYIVSCLAGLLPPGERSRLILCHLGNGASICAVRDGVSIDTSMGFTPLEGLVMGTRCGDLDPGLVLYLIAAGGESAEDLEEILNRKSGLLALSGRSRDVRDLEAAGDADSELALACFAYRARKYIGAYAAALGGVDALAFAGGIGEHSASMRARICEGLDFLGLALDRQANEGASGERPEAIGAPRRERVWIVPTNEELQIARETLTLLHTQPAPSS